MEYVQEWLSVLVPLGVLMGVFMIAKRAHAHSKRATVDQQAVDSSRRQFFKRVAGLAGFLVTATIVNPFEAFATHLRCIHSGVEAPYISCLGACSPTFTRCCVTSRNGVYYDCCTGQCYGPGCRWPRRYRVYFSLDNKGGCFCYLQTC